MALTPEPTPAMPAPGGAPGAPPAPPQQPFGSSPAAGPTANLGMQARGLQVAGAASSAMAMAIALLGASHPVTALFSETIKKLGKMLPEGAAGPQSEMNVARQLLMKNQQMMPQAAALKAQMMQRAQAGGAPQPSPQPSPAAPMPSAPMAS